MPSVTDAVAVGMLILVVAAFIPGLVDATQDQTEVVEGMENQTTKDITQRLTVELTDVSVVGSNATVEVRNSQSLNASEKLLNVSESKLYTIGGEDVTLTLDEVEDTPDREFITLTVTYPVTFGFGEGSQLFFENMELLIVLVGFIIVAGTLGVVTKS